MTIFVFLLENFLYFMAYFIVPLKKDRLKFLYA